MDEGGEECQQGNLVRGEHWLTTRRFVAATRKRQLLLHEATVAGETGLVPFHAVVLVGAEKNKCPVSRRENIVFTTMASSQAAAVHEVKRNTHTNTH